MTINFNIQICSPNDIRRLSDVPQWLYEAASSTNPSIYERRRSLHIKSLCRRLTYPNEYHSQFFKTRVYETPSSDYEVLIYCINHFYYFPSTLCDHIVLNLSSDHVSNKTRYIFVLDSFGHLRKIVDLNTDSYPSNPFLASVTNPVFLDSHQIEILSNDLWNGQMSPERTFTSSSWNLVSLLINSVLNLVVQSQVSSRHTNLIQTIFLS